MKTLTCRIPKSKANDLKNIIVALGGTLHGETTAKVIPPVKEPYKLLKSLMERDGISLELLSNKLAMHKPNVCSMVTGKRSISKNVAKILSLIFNVNYTRFL